MKIFSSNDLGMFFRSLRPRFGETWRSAPTGRRRRDRRPSPFSPRVERLEDRVLLSITPQGQYFVYLLNVARHDPQAYEQSADLPVDLSYVEAQPPLAVNDALFDSAQFHAEEMAGHDYFGHQSEVTGDWPNKMADDHGYELPSFFLLDENYIESIAAGTFYTTADVPLKELIVDEGIESLGHRNHLLSIGEFAAESREIGVGFAYSPTAHYTNYWAIHATRTDPNDTFLTGVVFTDQNGNGRYDLNEGISAATVTAGSLFTTTNSAGGWSIKVTSGTYTVAVSGGGFSGASSSVVTVGSDNIEVDFISGLNVGIVNFEPLPQLTKGRIDITVVVQPTSTDALGQVNSLPSSATWIDEWQPIWVEVWISTPASDAVGVYSAQATLSYNTNYYTATTVQPGAAFAGNLTQSINDATGRVQLSGQTTTASVIGANKHVLLARVLLQPGAGDPGVPLDVGLLQPASAATDVWISLVGGASASVALGSGTPAEVELGGSPATDLYPVLYDLNNDGRIGFGDLSIFAAAFLKNVGENAATYKADFDRSGRVGFGDFSLLVSNFLKSRSSSAPIVYPANFPDDWQAGVIASASAAAELRPEKSSAAIGLAWRIEPSLADDRERTVQGMAGTTPLSVGRLDAEEPIDFQPARSSDVRLEAQPAPVSGPDDRPALELEVLDELFAMLGDDQN